MFPKFLSITTATKYFDFSITILAESFVSKCMENNIRFTLF